MILPSNHLHSSWKFLFSSLSLSLLMSHTKKDGEIDCRWRPDHHPWSTALLVKLRLSSLTHSPAVVHASPTTDEGSLGRLSSTNPSIFLHRPTSTPSIHHSSSPDPPPPTHQFSSTEPPPLMHPFPRPTSTNPSSSFLFTQDPHSLIEIWVFMGCSHLYCSIYLFIYCFVFMIWLR